MREKPLVSVIIPLVNSEKFIGEAIESVFAQTYNHWELLLIDDGSTDISKDITLNYVNKNPDKVLYLEQEGLQNRGVRSSRNLGIVKAKGKYIAMLNADDVWVQNKLEQQVEVMEAYPEAGMVYGSTKYWHSWTKKTQSHDDRDYILDLRTKSDFLYKPPTLLTLVLESKITLPSMSNYMLRRNVIDITGGFEEGFTGRFEDQAFLSKIYINSCIFVANCCWDLHRQHPDTNRAVEIKNGDETTTELQYIYWLESYLSKNGITAPGLLYAIKKRKWKYNHPALSNILEHKQNNIVDIKEKARSIALRFLPISIRYYLLLKLRGIRYRPPAGWVHFGELRRLKPISEEWGADRGRPIDRYYIEKFLASNSSDIRGNVVEVGGDMYTNKFGAAHITKRDILCLVKGEIPSTTIAADLTHAPHIPSESFDCIICTQTLQLIYDVHSVIDTLHRILKPGGVVLATVPGISQTTDDEPWDRNWCWGFTCLSARKLFEEKFPAENLEVNGYGNVLVASSFLYGLAFEDLNQEELDYYDSRYEITITVRAVKPG